MRPVHTFTKDRLSVNIYDSRLSVGKTARHLCIVPSSTKTAAVASTLNEPISDSCPATILRQYQNVVLYPVLESSSILEVK